MVHERSGIIMINTHLIVRGITLMTKDMAYGQDGIITFNILLSLRDVMLMIKDMVYGENGMILKEKSTINTISSLKGCYDGGGKDGLWRDWYRDDNIQLAAGTVQCVKPNVHLVTDTLSESITKHKLLRYALINERQYVNSKAHGSWKC